ncbi:MAG: archaeal proteasome endopeptidase complex subunit beta [Candidatus Altiarchaeota archaeon]|nr:archaeal proteasome endopeptidase complex subunit beta [Candidatus Altiarchaeota archaeon]
MDGVVLVTDKRASMGSFIASKTAKKAFRINDRVAATIAGSVGDAEALIRLVQAEAALYEMNNGKRMSTKAVAHLMANVLQGSKYFPYLVQVLVGGMDENSSLYTLDPLGGLIEERMASTGSGSPVAYGVLELEYAEDKTVKENIPVALKAIGSAMGRDCATGDGISLITITAEGVKEYGNGEIDEHLKKIPRKAR